MNTKSVKRVSRTAAILTVPVAAALVISSAPASAAAGDLEVTTTIEYDYAVIDNGDGFTAGVAGSIPIFSTDPDVETDTNLYVTQETDTYLVGYNYNVESGESTVTGEVYPTENTTVGIESNLTTGETTVYAGYDDDTVAFGGEYNLTTGEVTVNASYTTDDYSVGGEYNLTTGEGSVYGEVYPDENTTVGVTASTDGSSEVYGSHETEVNDNVTIKTEWTYGLTDAAEEEPVAP